MPKGEWCHGLEIAVSKLVIIRDIAAAHASGFDGNL
jgi:hypothetical protein